MNANAMKQESSLVDSNGNGSSTPPKRGWVRTEQGWEPLDPRMQQIVFQIKSGRPFKDIAAQFGVTLSAISHARARAGRERRVKPRE